MSQPTTSSVTLLNDTWYNRVRQSATIILPAAGALYFALAQIWGLPKADEVTGTIAALNVFTGALAALSKFIYDKTGAEYDGTVNVVEADGKKQFQLELNGDPDELDSKAKIVFKVNSTS